MSNDRSLSDLTVIMSGTGLVVHLAVGARLPGPERKTLCGRPVNLDAEPHWFALAGCKRCARTALKAGVDHVHELNGEPVSVREVAGRPW